MNELFVPYAESLELKELGFNESTLYHWHSSCKTHPFTNEIFNPNCRPKTNSGIKDIGEENHVWSAPTFSQAFKFFREKYNLFGTILSDGFNGRLKGYHYSITEEGWINCYESIDDGKWYDIYEEAELECLRKLIEIAKTEKS